MNFGPRVVAVLLPGGAVCRHECWPHPGVGSSRQCLRGRGGQSGGFTSGTVRGDPARSPQRGPVDSGASRTPQGPPAGGAAALASALPPPRKEYVARPRPATDPWSEVIDAWLVADKDVPRKQRHTARRVWQRLVAEHGATLSEVTVSRYVARRRVELDLVHTEVFIPQTHKPGAEAEVDFGEFYTTLAGQQVKCWMFVMRLSHCAK